MTLHPIPLNFLIYEDNFISFFISAEQPARHDESTSINYVPGSFLYQDGG
jgi:hypothetical protein